MDRTQKFQNQLRNKYVFRIPLNYLCDLVLVNQCFRFNKKYILTLETEMKKLLQAADALPRNVDAEIIIISSLPSSSNWIILLEYTLKE